MNARDLERLRTVCAEVVGIDVEDLVADTDFYDDLNLGRDDLADVIVAVEDAFDISLESGLGQIRTFEDLETLVEDELPA